MGKLTPHTSTLQYIYWEIKLFKNIVFQVSCWRVPDKLNLSLLAKSWRAQAEVPDRGFQVLPGAQQPG